ncbi:MAG: GumC family protein [Acidobacteriaceae bacterium]
MGPHKTQLPPVAGVSEMQQPGMGSETRDTSLTEAVATLRKRQWVLILAAVLGLSYGAYKAYTQPKLFGATTTIQVHNGASNEYRVDVNSDYGDDQQTKMNTEVAILQSSALLTTVAREMDLANNPDFFGIKGPVPHQSLDDPNVRNNVVGELQGSMIVAIVPRTEMIRITYYSLSPKMAADIANRIIYDYIQRSYQTPVESTRRVSQWLSGQLDELKTEVEQSQEQIMALQRKLGTLGYDSSHSQLQSSLEELLSAEESAKVARITAESRYRMVAGMDPNTIGDSIETTPGTAPGELNTLRAQLATAKASYAELTAPGGVGENNPRAKSLQSQINTLTKEIDTEQSRLEIQAKETYLAAKAAEDKIEQELDMRKAEAYQQGDDLVQLTILQREFDQNRTLYDGLMQRLETAKVQAGLEALEVDVVDPALAPLSPTMRAPSSIIISNTVFFLLGGIVIVFILEGLDTGMHNIQEIETVMGMPSLAIIPQSKRTSVEQTATMSTAQRNIHVLTQPKSQFTEAFRALRTSLLLATAGQPPKFILFTSAMPSEGKTTMASNLACILSQSDVRVLLMDADLRRSNIHHRFGLTGKLGLTTVLAGTSTLEEAVQHIPETPNMDILPSGPVPPFPTEMLSSETMQALMKKLGKIYSHIVIDSPPVLSVTDAVVLGNMVDAVVLVVRHGKESKNVMRRARDLLARSGAPMTGLVLNAVDVKSPDYYGYYGYSGYSYGNIDADTWETQNSAPGKKGAEGKAKP